MNDLLVGIVVVVLGYVLLKMLYPAKVPSVVFCKDDSCWSTKQLPYWNPSLPKSTPADMRERPNLAEQSQETNKSVLQEHVSAVRTVEESVSRLEHVGNCEGLTTNYQAKYSK